MAIRYYDYNIINTYNDLNDLRILDWYSRTPIYYQDQKNKKFSLLITRKS